jgi:DNA-binding MarR family transcriptional regulator/N-acetylglutamate synthase-like GNAT family acetyltransferase
VAKKSSIDLRVGVVRRFNRFYTQRIGLLDEGLLDSPFSLSEVSVLYELAQREGMTATQLSAELGLDAGYLSRVLRSFEKRGLIDKKTSQADGRQSHLFLTEQGRVCFAPLEERSGREVAAMLDKLSPSEQARLLESMQTIEGLLGGQPIDPYLLRRHRPGDMGWIIHRHAVLYSQEYKWDEQFEALVAEIVAKFLQHYDPQLERCWVAEKNAEIIGCVFLIRQSKTVAKLRLLLVEPKARGLGLGSRLVEECVRFSRQANYRKIILWTNSVLHAARHIYQTAGFCLILEEPHHSFGRDLVGQTWELKL